MTTTNLNLTTDNANSLKASMLNKVGEGVFGRARVSMAVVHGNKIELKILEWPEDDDDDMLQAVEAPHLRYFTNDGVSNDGVSETRLLVVATIGNERWSAYARRGDWTTIHPTSSCSWPQHLDL